MSQFTFETLAYIFYVFHGDALQLLAATELYYRGWRFHKLFQVWLTPWKDQIMRCCAKAAREDDNYRERLLKITNGGFPTSGVVHYNSNNCSCNEITLGGESRCSGETWETGPYKFFHYGKWEFLVEEFKINEGLLEGKPPEFSDALWN